MKRSLFLYRHKKKILLLFCFMSLYFLKKSLERHVFSSHNQSKLLMQYQDLMHEKEHKEVLLQQYQEQKKALASSTFYQEKVAREELFLVKKGEFVFRV